MRMRRGFDLWRVEVGMRIARLAIAGYSGYF